MDSQEFRDPTTAQSAPTIAMVDKSLKITTRLASMLEFRSLESTQRSCLDSGNSRLVPALELRLLIKFGWRGIFSAESLKNTAFQYLSRPSSSKTGTALVTIPTSPPRPWETTGTALSQWCKRWLPSTGSTSPSTETTIEDSPDTTRPPTQGYFLTVLAIAHAQSEFPLLQLMPRRATLRTEDPHLIWTLTLSVQPSLTPLSLKRANLTHLSSSIRPGKNWLRLLEWKND